MKVLGTIAGVAVTGAIFAAFWISGAHEREMERQTVSFAAETVTAISDGWKPELLTERAEPGLIRAMASQGQSVGELFRIYRKLGASTSPPECRFKDTSQFGTGDHSYTTATVTCEGQFDNGPATFLLTLRQHQDSEDWKVYYINISSPKFSAMQSQ